MSNKIPILQEISRERTKQDEKWGEQNHPIVDEFTKPFGIYATYKLPSEETAKNLYNEADKKGVLTWGHIITEELVEALSANNKEDMREELIQCGAVIVAMIESLDRNGK